MSLQRDQTSEREALLAGALESVAAELRLIDVGELIALIHSDHHPNISDLVNSSSELFFAEGTLRYGWAAEFELQWEGRPTIMFGMEFRRAGVTAFFRLVLTSDRTRVDLYHITFADPAPRPDENTRRLAAVLAESQLRPFLDNAA